MPPQMGDIQRRCESLAAGLLGNEDVLDRALGLTAGHRESGALFVRRAVQNVPTVFNQKITSSAC